MEKLVFWIVAIPLAIGTRAFVLSRLWEYFIVPMGAPPLPIVGAIGLLFMHCILSSPGRDFEANDENLEVRVIAVGVVAPLLVWAICYPLHLYL